MAKRRQVAKAAAGVKRGTVLDHYSDKYGVHRGAVRAAHFAQIAIVVNEHGRDFTNDEYIAYWGVSVRTGWMHRAEAEEVYGDKWRDVAEQLAQLMFESKTQAPGAITRLAFGR